MASGNISNTSASSAIISTSISTAGNTFTSTSGVAGIAVTVGIFGVTTASTAGAIVSAISKVLAGSTLNSNASTLTAKAEYFASISGVTSTSQARSVVAYTSLGVVAVATYQTLGNLLGSLATSASPASSTTSIGQLLSSRGILGGSVSASVGTILGATSLLISSNQYSTTTGAVSPSHPATANISGVTISSTAGVLFSTLVTAVMGVVSNSQAVSPGTARGIFPVGVVADTLVGVTSPALDATADLTGVSATTTLVSVSTGVTVNASIVSLAYALGSISNSTTLATSPAVVNVDISDVSPGMDVGVTPTSIALIELSLSNAVDRYVESVPVSLTSAGGFFFLEPPKFVGITGVETVTLAGRYFAWATDTQHAGTKISLPIINNSGNIGTIAIQNSKPSVSVHNPTSKAGVTNISIQNKPSAAKIRLTNK